jgi:hypothetical protein
MVEFAELIKSEVLELYHHRCKASNIHPHRAFVRYLEETYDENDSIEIVIQGNDKLNFNNRVTDHALIAICSTLEKYAIYIEDIDLRYNQLTDIGAKALGDLISKSPRLLGLNL